jgi:hypothetical protein
VRRREIAEILQPRERAPDASGKSPCAGPRGELRAVSSDGRRHGLDGLLEVAEQTLGITVGAAFRAASGGLTDVVSAPGGPVPRALTSLAHRRRRFLEIRQRPERAFSRR